MAEEDEENTAFITSQGMFCYSKMSFGLKNIKATYQRLLDKAFQKQIGRNLEVYVDDLVIKSRMEQKVIRDIEKIFKTLKEINMKLNPKKCTFGIRECMFQGYKVNADGLKVCPDKIEAVLSFPSSKCLKDVQRLNGKLASLNRFLSKSAEKSLPFFKTLKKSNFQWTAEAKMAFKQMKTLIAKLRMLTAPKEKEDLVIYLAAAKEADSAVLMTEKGGKQMPIYFVSHQPIKQVLSNSEVVGRLLMWRFELEECDIHYRPRTSVKGQILVDFIIERPKDDSPDTPMKDKEELLDPFNATNNEAEYEALIAGLRIAEQMRVKNLQANVDSRLVANQVNKTYVAKEPGMIKYLEKGIDIAGPFSEGPSKVKFLIVAIDYFTKWIEAKPVATITGAQIKNSGITHSKIGAKSYVSINALLPLNIHKPTACNGETPISLTYETEAVIPVEIGMPTLRTATVYMVKNDEALEINSDLLEEKREQAAIQEAKKDGGKLVPKWEGQYEVTEALGKGAYKLRDRNGNILP
uniref:Reverse transcriptase domain-containing protein n=1 Tax=Tanacetum cinerariifolium TaxID=118510 RepID=A0A699HIX1_TANCI|nr:reverse transcriptase domain-containing protein [Tanacetum cinerariifolium]